MSIHFFKLKAGSLIVLCHFSQIQGGGLALAQPAAGPARPEVPEVSVQQATTYLKSRTHLSFMPVHGTQVSYSSGDGKVYLWYPGNRVVLAGEWQVRTIMTMRGVVPPATGPRPLTAVCFRYGANTWNPATGQGGGKFECTPATSLMRHTVENVTGDVFSLSKRSEPHFILAKEKTTIADLRKKIGRQ